MKVSESVMIYSDEHKYDYCDLLTSSLKGNLPAIKKISLLDFENAGAYGYDHGSVLIDLIKIIGVKKYMEGIATVSPSEKHRIQACLDVGLMYGSDADTIVLKNAYPELHSFLNSN